MSHIHKKIDYTADALIVCGNRVLLRMHEKYHMWLAVGGHIELDEDPNKALMREVKEEVGLDIEMIVPPRDSNPDFYPNDPSFHWLIPPRFMNRHKISETHDHISLYYLATARFTDIQPAAGEPITECHWFSAEELDEPQWKIWPHMRFYAQRAIIEVNAAGPTPAV